MRCKLFWCLLLPCCISSSALYCQKANTSQPQEKTLKLWDEVEEALGTFEDPDCQEPFVIRYVESLADFPDADLSDGVCADQFGYCTLRAAIEEANSSCDLDVIRFNVSGDIVLSDPLPVIYERTHIDGLSAPYCTEDSLTIKIRSSGFDVIRMYGADGSKITGLDISAAPTDTCDHYGIEIGSTELVEISHNVIRNRVRAIYANNACKLKIIGNDIRDSGEGSSNGAIHLTNLCDDRARPILWAFENEFGSINVPELSGIQVLGGKNVVTSDGSADLTNIRLGAVLSVAYPIRYANVNGGSISHVDLSADSARTGIGLRLLNSDNILVRDVGLRNRRMGLRLTRGTNNHLDSLDLRNSGSDSYFSTIRAEYIDVDGRDDLTMTNLQLTPDVHTVLSLDSCRGVVVSDDTLGLANITLGQQVLSGHSPVQVSSCDSVFISGLNVIKDSLIADSQGIKIDLNSNFSHVDNCLVEGYATGLNLAHSQNTFLHCNTLANNKTGILVAEESSIVQMGENGFFCNRVGLKSASTELVVSHSDYWGHSSGSSSYSGLGDYYLGFVNAHFWLEVEPECLKDYDTDKCSFEDCSNGIDDDGDGIIDCL